MKYSAKRIITSDFFIVYIYLPPQRTPNSPLLRLVKSRYVPELRSCTKKRRCMNQCTRLNFSSTTRESEIEYEVRIYLAINRKSHDLVTSLIPPKNKYPPKNHALNTSHKTPRHISKPQRLNSPCPHRSLQKSGCTSSNKSTHQNHQPNTSSTQICKRFALPCPHLLTPLQGTHHADCSPRSTPRFTLL